MFLLRNKKLGYLGNEEEMRRAGKESRHLRASGRREQPLEHNFRWIQPETLRYVGNRDKKEETEHFRLYPELYEWVVQHGGSISAEHGIGQMKLPYSKLIRSPEDREIIQKLKKTFDPNGILNPGKFMWYLRNICDMYK